MNSSLRLYKTHRYTVLGLNTNDAVHPAPSRAIPVLRLMDLLTCRLPSGSIEEYKVQEVLWAALQSHGFLVLSYSPYSEPGRIIQNLKQSLHQEFFPDPSPQDSSHKARNVANLQSGSVYVNEKDVPMFKLGYELCDDIREVFRVHAGSPDSQPWPGSPLPSHQDDPSPRNTWLRAMALCRHICDEALRLTLGYNMDSRPGSGPWSWKTPTKPTIHTVPYYQQHVLVDRLGDTSVMYAMHYFNDHESIVARTSGRVTGTNDIHINVKEHTDPSLFVLEPFLADVEGLQVCPRPSTIPQPDHNTDTDYPWISCDGFQSTIRASVEEPNGDMAMILFVGRAFSQKAKELTGHVVIPTLHRVVGPSVVTTNQGRRTVIYEQKYEEYFE